MKRLFQAAMCAAVLFSAVSAYKAVSFATERHPSSISYYSETGVVISVDEEIDLVTVRTSLNLKYQFIADGYKIGDMCSLLMDDMDTGNFLDDIIVQTRYVGNPSDYNL